MIDVHAHVLPGIDDGAPDWDVTLEMLKRCAEAGVEKIIATPHYIPWAENKLQGQVSELCREAEKKLLNKHGIVMDIYPGNEIYYSLDVIQKLKDGEILTLAGSRYVLVEFSTGISYPELYRAVKAFTSNGYIPIIAHVERYMCLRKMARLQELKEAGALFQMNVGAFQGGIMDSTSRWAKKCLRMRVIDFLASDMHDLERRVPLERKRLRWLQKKLEPGYQKQLLYHHAQKLLDNIRI